jgi:phosphonate C-P lyase system protein PhnG
MDQDYILCECALPALELFVTSLEPHFSIQIAKAPVLCMTMIQAEDSVEFQPFYLGEVLTTECQLVVNLQIGYGICMGDEPVKSYCIAFIDAVTQLNTNYKDEIDAFLNTHYQLIEQAKQIEYNQILRTKVDFKIMEQE